MILLDTDTLTHLTRQHPRVVERALAAPERIAISIITQIEILQGRFAAVMKAANGMELEVAQDRLVQAQTDLATLSIIEFDHPAMETFDQLKDNKRLKSIGRADLLIACIALAYRATLVTRNLRHFRQVPGLKIENWVD